MKEAEVQLKRSELQNRLDKLLVELNPKQDLFPCFSKTQAVIFNQFLNRNERSSFSICTGIGLSATNVIKESEKILDIAQVQFSRKQEIEYLLKHYGGRESIESMANALPNNYRIIILNYMLTQNPNREKLKQELGITYDKIDSYEFEAIDLLDKMYPKKLEIDKLVEQAGGKDYIFNVYANSLTETQRAILIDLTLSYLPLNPKQISKNLHIDENEIINENNFLLEDLNKKININNQLLKALQNLSISGLKLNISANKLRKILSSMPTIHQDFAEAYFGDGKSLNQISRETGLSLGTISSRKKHFFEIFYELSLKDEKNFIVNTNAKTFKTVQRFSNTFNLLTPYKKKLAIFEPEIDTDSLEGQKELFKKYLYPFITETQIKIFEENILVNSGKSAEVLAKELGDTNYQYIYSTANSICSKLDYIIDKQIKINELYERFGGKEGLEDLSEFLTEPQKLVLKNYYLNLDPYSNSKTLEILKRTKTGKNGFGSIRESLMEKLDEMLSRKIDCQKFIVENGGLEFLNKFAEILSEEHKFVFNKTMIDYHYTTLRDISLKLGKFDHYAMKSQKLICEKLANCLQKEAWAENIADILGDSGIRRFSDKLSEREQKLLFGFTLNSFALSITDYCNSTGENYAYVSKTSKKQTKKLNELVKEKTIYYRGF